MVLSIELDSIQHKGEVLLVFIQKDIRIYMFFFYHFSFFLW